MGVMGRPTRPLPVPGPWGLPGPYQVYAGTRLKTKPEDMEVPLKKVDVP